jgi:hypothetical protein
MATRRRSLERGDEKPHRLHVQLPKRRSWLLTSEQGLGSLHEPHVLFSGAELHGRVAVPKS